ncbi:hypothetical protein GS845_13415 [Rhodococcus hoagii]|nr:hypothetical protein [Prescottella equi]
MASPWSAMQRRRGVTFALCRSGGIQHWGVGFDQSVTASALHAVLAAAARVSATE